MMPTPVPIKCFLKLHASFALLLLCMSLFRTTIGDSTPQSPTPLQATSKIHGHTSEEKLVRRLMRPYEKAMRPVYNHTDAVTVRISVTLSQIIDVDLRHQKIITTIWLDHEWIDQRLTWNPDEYAGIKVLRLPHQMLWLPDVVLYNSADDQSSYMDSLLIVNGDGSVFWPPIAHFHSYCRMDVTYFPYDDQFFYLKFGSWSHSGDLVDVEIRNAGVDLSNYIPNGEWNLVEVKATRNVIYYPCCPEPFPDLTFYFHIRRRLLYYLLNIILPTTTLSVLALLSFCLPPHCSEKVTLSLTVLLAYTVFLMTISESLPRTSDVLPIFSVFITLVMTVTAASTVCSIFVIQVRYRGRTGREPPGCLLILARKGIIVTFFSLLRRILLWLVKSFTCGLFCRSSSSPECGDNTSESVGSPTIGSIFDRQEPFSIHEPKGLGVGRDEQEFMFTVIDEWDEGDGGAEDAAHHLTAAHTFLEQQPTHPRPSPISKSQFDTSSQHSRHILPYLNDEGMVDGDESETSEEKDNVYNEVDAMFMDTAAGELDDFSSVIAAATPLVRRASSRKRVLAYKRSPLWDRSSHLCKANASRYERDLTSMLRTLAKQHRYETRDSAIEKLWTEVSTMLNRCFLVIFLLINFAATITVLVIIPYAKSDTNIDGFIQSRNLLNHTTATSAVTDEAVVGQPHDETATTMYYANF